MPLKSPKITLGTLLTSTNKSDSYVKQYSLISIIQLTILFFIIRLKNTYRITAANNASISSKFSSIEKDSKSIFRLSTKLLCRSLKPPLPVATPEELPLLFDNFFSDKLANILATLATPATPLSQPITNPRPGVSLEQLQTPSLTLIISLLKDTKTCSSLDPLPLVLSKQVTSNIAILLLPIICTSLSTGCVPTLFKKAVITPILKKSNLDSLSLPNPLQLQ